MKWICLFFFPALSFAAKIPVESFDQGKLEQLLRRIPSALVKTEEMPGFIRRHTQFPQTQDAPFVINCQADFYGGTEFPSSKSCDLDLKREPEVGDEVVVNLSEPVIVQNLNAAISYGQEVKKFISNELVYAQSSNGKYKKIFRFAFSCKTDTCETTFATKEAE